MSDAGWRGVACGDKAALSHHSAAALWGIGIERASAIDVSVRRRCELRRPGLRVRGRPTLRAEDVTSHRGLPLTVVTLTLVDLATELGEVSVERAVNEADKLDLIDPETLRLELERYSGMPGAPRLRRLLDKHTFRLSDSDLEIFFRPIARAAGLSQPLSKQIVNGFEVDFFWPELGLVVETEAFATTAPSDFAPSLPLPKSGAVGGGRRAAPADARP